MPTLHRCPRKDVLGTRAVTKTKGIKGVVQVGIRLLPMLWYFSFEESCDGKYGRRLREIRIGSESFDSLGAQEDKYPYTD